MLIKGLDEKLIPAACFNVSNHLSALQKQNKVGKCYLCLIERKNFNYIAKNVIYLTEDVGDEKWKYKFE